MRFNMLQLGTFGHIGDGGEWEILQISKMLDSPTSPPNRTTSRLPLETGGCHVTLTPLPSDRRSGGHPGELGFGCVAWMSRPTLGPMM